PRGVRCSKVPGGTNSLTTMWNPVSATSPWPPRQRKPPCSANCCFSAKLNSTETGRMIAIFEFLGDPGRAEQGLEGPKAPSLAGIGRDSAPIGNFAPQKMAPYGTKTQNVAQYARKASATFCGMA